MGFESNSVWKESVVDSGRKLVYSENEFLWLHLLALMRLFSLRVGNINHWCAMIFFLCHAGQSVFFPDEKIKLGRKLSRKQRKFTSTWWKGGKFCSLVVPTLFLAQDQYYWKVGEPCWHLDVTCFLLYLQLCGGFDRCTLVWRIQLAQTHHSFIAKFQPHYFLIFSPITEC